MSYKKITNVSGWNGIIRGVEFFDSEAQDFLTNSDIAYIQGVLGHTLEDVDGSPADVVYVLDADNVNGDICGVTFLNSKAVGNLSQYVIDQIQRATGMTVSVNVAPTITEETLDEMEAGSAFVQTIHATGGNQPYTWTVVGTLPTGIEVISGSPNCTIQGTPTTGGAYEFSLVCRDTNGDNDRNDYTGNVRGALTITNESLPNGMINQEYNEELTASGGDEDYTFEVTDGALPDGLEIVGSSIVGTPTVMDSFGFTITVTDGWAYTAEKEFAIIIIQEISIVSTTLPDGYNGSTYSKQIEAGGGAAPYTWSIHAGSLPDGLTLDINTGVISGTPTVEYDDNVTIRVQDSSPVPFVADKQFGLVIEAGLTFVSPTFLKTDRDSVFVVDNEVGSVGIAVEATGGKTPYTFTKTGTIPTGLTLGSDGNFTGTPTAVGTWEFSVTCTDSATPANVVTKEFVLTIAPKISIVANDHINTLPAMMEGLNYEEVGMRYKATGGSGTYDWDVTSGDLSVTLSDTSPDEIIIGGANDVDANVRGVSIKAIDSVFDTEVVVVAYVGTVAGGGSVITALGCSDGLTNGKVGEAYSEALTPGRAGGGTAPLSFAVKSGSSLPTGLSMSSAGLISGTPTQAVSAHAFTLVITDSTPMPNSALIQHYSMETVFHLTITT
jgi:large repetitive protein